MVQDDAEARPGAGESEPREAHAAPSPSAPPEVEAEPFDPDLEPGPTVDAPGAEKTSPTGGSTLWPTLCHLSPLLAILVATTGIGILGLPFLLIAAPLVIWQGRKEDPFTDDQGREAVNFQINVAAVTTLLAFSCIGLPLAVLVLLTSIVLSLIAAVQASEGRRYRYPWIYRVLKP